MTWNCEGFSRNSYNLLKILQDEAPSFIFLAEPWLHLPDAHLALKEYHHQYSYYLNSDDRHDPLLSLNRSRAHGGTLAIWKKEYDPYVSIIEPSTSRVLAIVLEKPGMETGNRITIYLPTAGKDAEFARELSILKETMDSYVDSSHDVLVSTILLQHQPELQKSCDNIKAPRIEYSKHKILWTEDGISAYQQLLSHALPPLQHDYCDVSEPEIASVLF